MKTYEQALLDQWTIAAHRMAYAKDAEKDGKSNRSCRCDECKEHLAAMELGPTAA